MAVLVVVSMAAVPIGGLAAVGDGPQTDSHDGTETGTDADDNASVAPGERLSGVVGVQGAELEGEIGKRSFGISVARAATNDSKADVVAAQFSSVGQRIAELRSRQQNLNESRENGSVSEGKYRAQVAELSARMQNARQMATETGNASQGLPADLLESKGINATAIQTLKERAGELGGPQVAAIARGIAGPGAAPGDRVPENANRGQAPDRNATAEDNTTATTTPSGQTADSDTPDNRTADGDAESTRGGR
jgi:hypothetical protein